MAILCISCIRSVFTLYYFRSAFNPNAVWVEGPGVQQDGMTIRQTATFTVHTEQAGDGKLEVKCIGPRKYLSQDGRVLNLRNTFCRFGRCRVTQRA